MTAKHLVLVEANHEQPSTLHLQFGDGVCMRVDVVGLTANRAADLEVLQDPATIMRTEPRGVGWWGPTGRVQFSSYELRSEAIHQATGRGPSVLRDWMSRHEGRAFEFAWALGVQRRSLVDYLSAKRPVPKKLVLAILALKAEGWPEWTEEEQPPPEPIVRWLARYGYTRRAGAQALGVSLRMLAYYISGQKPTPEKVLLAMRGWCTAVKPKR